MAKKVAREVVLKVVTFTCVSYVQLMYTTTLIRHLDDGYQKRPKEKNRTIP